MDMEADIGHHPLPSDGTVKRLDFEDILVATMPMDSTASLDDLRTELFRIRRELEGCREAVPDQNELLEPFREAVADIDSINIPKLSEEYIQLKEQFLRLEAENHFLEHYLAPGDSKSLDDSNVEGLKKQLSELSSKSADDIKEIESLICKFVTEMETFHQATESAFSCIDECAEKINSWTVESTSNLNDKEEYAVNTEADDLEAEACQLAKLVGKLECEILDLNKEVATQERYYEHLKSLHGQKIKLDLLGKVFTFFSDWNVVECEDEKVTLIFKSLTPQVKRSAQATRYQHQKVTNANAAAYKLHLKVHETTLAVEDVKLEPNDDVVIDDIVQELAFRRTMHSLEVTPVPHNDLEFLLRRIGQRILLSRKPHS